MANTITIEDAVARMVNVGEIPVGVSLMEHLAAIAQKAEDDRDDAIEQQLPSKERELLEFCVKANEAKYTLAGILELHIKWELDTPSKISLLKISPDSGNTIQLEMASVADWALVNYGIERFDYEELSNQSRELPTTRSDKRAETIAKEKGLTPTLAKRLYITLALALEELVSSKENTVGFGTADDINVSQIAELLCVRGAFRKNYDTEILKTRIEEAISMKKLFGKN